MNLDIERISFDFMSIDDIEKKVKEKLKKQREEDSMYQRGAEYYILQLINARLFSSEDRRIKDIEKSAIVGHSVFQKEREKRHEEVVHYFNAYVCNLVLSDKRILKSDRKKLDKIEDLIISAFDNYEDRWIYTYSNGAFKDLICNLDLWCNCILEFKWWDTQFNIELFAETLMRTGSHIRKNGHLVNSEKMGRRAMAMGGYLKKAYDDSSIDPALLNIYNKSKGAEYLKDRKSTIGKMYDTASNRVNTWEQERQATAWENIGKPVGGEWKAPRINYIWD